MNLQVAEEVTIGVGLPNAPVCGRVRLVVCSGPDAGFEAELEHLGRVVRLGTAPDNDLVLSDRRVSRHHCELQLAQNSLGVKDTRSKNGIFVQGVRLTEAQLVPPFELKLGATTISVTSTSQPPASVTRRRLGFDQLCGESSLMHELRSDLARVAHSDVSVLIEGDTGTGKELVARSVHQTSTRAQGPYVVFDCAATAPSLVESELFGHERGAFTGAHGERRGVFEQADGGTIFLDELGEMPASVQPKLLRVLETGEVHRLGSTRSIPVDFRVVSATNKDLLKEIKLGRFRQDLYFRLAGLRVRVPALRERSADIPRLVDHFLDEFSPGMTHRELPPQLLNALKKHDWPGNVRELRNVVQRYVLAPDKPWMSCESPDEDGTRHLSHITPLRVARREAADRFERDYLIQVLQRSGGNVTRAAAIAEVSRQMVQKLLRRHSIVS